MKVFPNIQVRASSDLKPGDLFMAVDHSFGSFFAIRTVEGSSLILGPKFNNFFSEPRLIDLNLDVQLSYGNDYTIILPERVSAWRRHRPSSVSLVLAKTGTYICFNSNRGLGLPCFIDLANGEIIHNLREAVVFTDSWQFCVSDSAGILRKIVEFPLLSVKEPQ
jgi:hypothetical protein